MQSVPREDFEKYLDREDVIKRLGGNQAILKTLLKKFLADVNEAKLKEALAAGDLEGAKTASHNIKGLAGNLSLRALHKAATDLNTALKAGEAPGEMPQTLYEISAKTVFVINAALAEG